MKKIEKFLQNLTPKERAVAIHLLERVKTNDLDGLNVKKLRGFENLFRVRKGELRVIYHRGQNGQINILDIRRKDDTTYN